MISTSKKMLDKLKTTYQNIQFHEEKSIHVKINEIIIKELYSFGFMYEEIEKILNNFKYVVKGDFSIEEEILILNIFKEYMRIFKYQYDHIDLNIDMNKKQELDKHKLYLLKQDLNKYKLLLLLQYIKNLDINITKS